MECMGELGQDGVCLNCGKTLNLEQSHPFRAKKSLVGKRYILGKGVSQDAEGLNYVGFDLIKNQKVFIREFFPEGYCNRQKDQSIELTDKPNVSTEFKKLYTNFLRYFRCIAKLRNLSSITAVYDILEENQTVYVIMEWVDGESLDKYISSHSGRLKWQEARVLFMPLLFSLSKMSAVKVYHLGIAPCNIIITLDNTAKLTGFMTPHFRMSGTQLKTDLIDGCSAIEQYTPGGEISECTDVYGYAATLFFALTGEYPVCATQRIRKDKLLMASHILKELPENVVAGLANALRVDPHNRTLSFETLKIELSNSPVIKVKNIYDEENSEFNPKTPKNRKKSKTSYWGIISCISSVLVLLTAFGVYWFWIKEKNSDIDASTKEQVSSPISTLDEESSDEKEGIKVEVPQLVGKSVSKAQNAATAENPYNIVVISEEFHDSIEEGLIISQTPAYGEEMYAGSIITVNVSKGPSKRELPSIVGKSLSEASMILSEAKFKPSEVRQSNNKFPAGTVIGYQDYKSGDLIDYGSEVVIIVSKG